jgi:NRAMP (natural resistance-associated macrophage protein)-like metal ion transporter
MQPDVGGILQGLFVPSVSFDSLFAMAGLIGCIIMPHNLYLHSSIVQSREIDRNDVIEVTSSI